MVGVETVLSMPFQVGYGGPVFRLTAKYDLFAVDPGKRAMIVDWKTTRRRTELDVWLSASSRFRIRAIDSSL